MLQNVHRLTAVVLAAFVALPALAQSAGKEATAAAVSIASIPLPVTNSAKDTEIAIARLLKDRLQLESFLKLVDDNPDNLRLLVTFRTDEKQGFPRVSAIIDTAVVARDKDGNAVSQSIYIAATADIPVREALTTKLLQWSNAWNARMLPIRVYISGGRIYTGAFVLGTINEPATSNRVLSSFLSVVRAWPAIIRDLQANKFIPEK
jgi:hypothetical protein